MFDSKVLINKKKSVAKLIILVFVLVIFSSCLPTSTAPSLKTSNSTNDANNSGTTPLYQEPSYPYNTTFIQEGTYQTTTNFTLPLNYVDSFLIRGKDLSVYLRKLPLATNFCFVGKYNYLPGYDRFIVLSAKPKFYTDLVNKTTEYYLQVEPSNDVANQNDCLTYNLSNVLFTNASLPSLSFSLQQLCSTCSTAVSSTTLKLYFINGEQVPSISLGSLSMIISGNSSTSGNTCAEASVCKARGFDCCLDSQCVKDAAIRPSALTSSGFVAAQEDVRLNPSRFVLYPQFYYVCNSNPGTIPDNTNGGSTPNPDYDAAKRILEMTQLYQCLNQVDGEFSYCTVKFAEASKNIPGNFSASSLGYKDDMNFSTLNSNYTSTDYANNIVKIYYAGKTLYELNKTTLTDASFVTNTSNDNVAETQSVNITSSLPANAQDDSLYLTYKIDGTCEKISTTLARCKKTYVQESTDTYSSTWHNNSKTYFLPTYADVSNLSSIIVKIGGIVVPEGTNTWSRAVSNVLHNGVLRPKPRIEFSASYPIYQNQVIEISYFVSSGVDELTKMKDATQATVNSMCTCMAGVKCNLRPLYDTNKNLINYECVYPSLISDEPPANQTIYVSNKNVPHRYFDSNGVNYDEDYINALDQEILPLAFSYTNNDVLRPNNINSYVGFNEIYGSFAKSGTLISRPAKLVKIKKDRQYDIIIDSGVFSSCTTCGSDYYSSLQKIFPQSFSGNGGGYSPDYLNSTRENSSSIYRSDDLLYGRACFVPATMIPWTHATASSPIAQRRARLAAQHFLFANGYNRDWYGFDYGSIIGSFDGVRWFSVGSQRRIKATSSRLYLAVNAYYGDLNIDNNFKISVMESTAYSSSIPEHDTNSNGAECQRAHFCSHDNDCFRNLGYDYTCQNIAGLTTNWPQFDANGTEVVGSISKGLASIVGGTNGQSKRCVYRGRGAPCLSNLANSTSTTFNGTSITGTLGCSSNNSCLSTTSNRFNDRIARFANTPLAQNLAEVVTPAGDTVGLGAKIIGRPYNFFGTNSVPSSALAGLSQNNVAAICVPGKDVANATTTNELNSRHPTTRTETADKLYGVGTTLSSTSMNLKYFNACPATDATGTSLQQYNYSMTDSTLSNYAISQNLSSNLLDLAPLRTLNIFSSTSGSQVKSIGYQKNTCLRAPGASCFSDMECAPSNFIASKAKAANFSGILNEAEEKYWEEELVCGNPDFKYLQAGVVNPNFSIKKNVCCRDTGKTISVYTQTDTSQYHWCDSSTNKAKVAGVNTTISSLNRYSRVHTGYDKMTCDRTNLSTSSQSFALSLAAGNSTDRLTQILKQYKTLDAINQRTCCTKNWVRSFATENGGGHEFHRNKMQTINKEMFKHITWMPQTTAAWATDSPFYCDPLHYTDSSCEIRTITPMEEEKYLTWAGSLELIGIPQVAVKTNNEIYKLVNNSQADISTTFGPLDNSIEDVNLVGEDFQDSSAIKYYSAASYNKFKIGAGSLKKIFSENEFNCCLPTGQEVPQGTTKGQCCTGYLANTNGPNRCCLPDYTNVTVYLNRYVSSQGSGLPDNAYDEKTGYIKDPGQVMLLANQKNICCSNQTATGVAISTLHIPLVGDIIQPITPTNSNRRFNYRTDSIDNNSESKFVGSDFDDGVRWNNHVYCVPDGFNQN